MRPPPLHVMAKDHRTAENFVRSDMQDSPRRLNYIDDPRKLYGRPGLVIHVHTTAVMHQYYRDIMEVARRNGCIFLHVDDTYARERHYAEQQARYAANYTYTATKGVLPKIKV